MFRNIVGHNYGYSRGYFGPLKAAILDWSGTTADKYVIAPAAVFMEVFKLFDVPITMQEARFPMGLRKDLHIKEITKMPEVRKRWIEKKGSEPTDLDVQAMFKEFVPAQLKCLNKYSTLIPGTVETVNTLRNEYNLKIGSTTGFTKEMVDSLLSDAKAQGYTPDSSVAGDQVENGERPKPFMLYRNLELLNVNPIQSVVKVDDTVGGVGEGLEGGCWTVGLSRYSNYMDVDSLEHEMELSEDEMQYKLNISRDILRKSGAHYVVDSITDLPGVVKHINNRLSYGDRP